VAKGGKMGKEQEDKSQAAGPERTFKAAVGLNALHNANTVGNRPSLEVIQEGLRAVADMPAEELQDLVEKGKLEYGETR
jgi:hypothetical protein